MTNLQRDYSYDNGYILLNNLSLKDLPKRIYIKDSELRLKSEFHITLVCAKKLAAIIDNKKVDKIQSEIVKEFLTYVKKKPLKKYNPLQIFRYVQREEKKTVIMMVEVPGLNDFFNLIAEKYRTKLPLPPTHITLYTLQPDEGIGILSVEEINNDTALVGKVDLIDNQIGPNSNVFAWLVT